MRYSGIARFPCDSTALVFIAESCSVNIYEDPSTTACIIPHKPGSDLLSNSVNKQVGARPPGGRRCDMQPSQIITDKYHKKSAFPKVKCIYRPYVSPKENTLRVRSH